MNARDFMRACGRFAKSRGYDRTPVPFSPDRFKRLQRAVRRRFQSGSRGGNKFQVDQFRERRVSLLLAIEMRKRGWIAEEGYAPGSWADPRNAND